jgi:hypothetical protein
LFFVAVFLCFSLLFGKIEERNDSVIQVQVASSPATGEWKTAYAVLKEAGPNDLRVEI